MGLLFHFLDEWLFVFSAEDFFIPRVCKYVNLIKILDIHVSVFI